MQRRIDAVRQLEHSVSRRAARNATKDTTSRVTDETRHTTWQKQYLRDLVRTARVNRREDYDCGPRLAPRRDIGEREFSYGAMHHRVLQPRKTMIGLDGRAGVPLIAIGDRVVLLAGRDRGKIGEVVDVEVVSMTCRVRGLNEVKKTCISEFTFSLLSLFLLLSSSSSPLDTTTDRAQNNRPRCCSTTKPSSRRNKPKTAQRTPWPSL